MLLLPFKQLLEIIALPRDIEIGERMIHALRPAIRDQFLAGLAHEVLGQRLLAMREMRMMGRRHTVRVVSIEILMQALPQGIEAVDQVQTIQMGQMSIRAQVPTRRRLDNC